MPKSSRPPRPAGRADISVIIAGEAGDGILFTGNVLAKAFKRHGWEALTYRDFPSNIRGEPTRYTIRAALKKDLGRPDRADIILTFDCGLCRELIPSLALDGLILCDGEGTHDCDRRVTGRRRFHRFLLRKLAKEHFGSELYKNMIVLGGLARLLGLEMAVLETIIEETFLQRKGPEVVATNVLALRLGFEKAGEMVGPASVAPLPRKTDEGRIILSGDEAMGFGALAAGCRLFAAYPICPASEVWQWLVTRIPGFNGLVVQTEDELAALNMALGASYAGARAMTSTSGPGGSLMMEAFGLAGMAEIPVVIGHVQRVGPSTGIPTKSEQSDILLWVFGGHGDFPRLVLTPGTVEECFTFTVQAFNLAEKYQCPVVVLIDEDLGHNLRTTRAFDLSPVAVDRGKLLTAEQARALNDYRRYAFTADGISPRALPSWPNAIHMVEGNEHNEYGLRDEGIPNRIRMTDKRMRKLKAAVKDILPPRVWGDAKARVGLIGIGSTLGAAREAMEALQARGVKAKLLQLRQIWPFPVQAVEGFLAGCRSVFVLENNASGQLTTLVRSAVPAAKGLRRIAKYSSQSFQPSEIVRPLLGTRQ